MNHESRKRDRLFLGIQIAKLLQDEIGAWQDLHRSIHPAIRWVPEENLHVTLIPPWHAERNLIARQLESFRVDLQPFPISFRLVAYGPRPRAPRLIWATGETPRALIELRDRCEKHLCGAQSLQPLALHMTLARFDPKRFSEFGVKKLEERVSWSMTVNKLTLYVSHREPDGARYEVVSQVVL